MRGDSIGPSGVDPCGGGSIPVYVEGQGFRGCYSPDESWIIPFLDNTGKFATLPADDPAISNLIDPEEGKKLKEWNELKEAYENGEATLRDLQNFDPGALSSNETWMGQYNDFVTQESQAPKTWEKIEEILRRNGYSDDEIQEVKDSIRPPGGEFRGSLVLPGILGDLGYTGGDWWGVRPSAGQPCTVYAENNDPLADQTADPNNPLGEYDADGNCVPLSSERQPGQPCPTAEGEGGIISANGDCETDFTQGVKCNATVDGVLVEGKRDANGDCVALDDGSGDEGANGETPDCTVVTQENAEECGFTIDETGNLVDKDRGDEDGIAPFYTNCGGGIWADPDTECPDVGGVGEFCNDPANANEPECVEKSFQDYVNEVGEDVANTAKGIYEDFKDVITDCVGNPTECIKKIGDKILDAGIPEKCQDLKDCSVADPDKGTYCWKDCVNFNVLAGIPGLPQLPGMGEIDVGTYRDFEDFLKGIGKDIGEFIEDPAGTLEGWKDAVLKKIKEIFGSVKDTDPNKIIDWLKGIFGVYAATWIWGEIEEEVLNTILPITGIDEKCEEIDEINADECGYKKCGETFIKKAEICEEQDNDGCTEGTKDPSTGKCICGPETGNPGVEEDIDGSCDGLEGPDCTGEITEDIAALCGKKKCGDEFIDAELVCQEDTTEVDCSLPENKDLPECQEETEVQPCDDPEAVRRGGLSDGECVKPGVICFTDPSKYPGDATDINQGQYNSEGFCVSPTGGGQCPEGNTPKYFPEDTDQDGTFFYNGETLTYDPCDPIGPENSLSFTPAPELVCNDLNAKPPEGDDGGCGDCKDNFVFDTESKICVPKDSIDNNTGGNQGDECDLENGSGKGVKNANGDCVPVGSKCNRQLLGYGSEDNCPTGLGYNTPIGIINANGDCECSSISEVDCSEITEDNYKDCKKVKCPEGSTTPYADSLDDCVTTGEPPETCDNDAVNYPDCNQCPKGKILYNGKCVVPTNAPCDEQNRVTNSDGTCGECKEGYTFDTNQDLCVRDLEECTNGATDYPACTTCPEGQSMDAENNCVTTGEPPVTPPPETGGGGGGGGGMLGSFTPFMAGISYTPQAVPEPPAPPQKDYMAELDNLIKRSLFEGMA